MDIFQDILNASATGARVFLRDGLYALSPKEIAYREAPTKGMVWTVKFIVLASVAQNEYQLGGEAVPHGTPGSIRVEPNPVGEEVSWTVRKSNKNFASNIKEFLLKFTNESEAEFNRVNREAQSQGKKMPADELMDLMAGTAQAARGYLIGVKTFRKVNEGRDNPANKGKLMTLPGWFHIPKYPLGMDPMQGNTQGNVEAAARRSQIEAGQIPALPAWLQIPGITPVTSAQPAASAAA